MSKHFDKWMARLRFINDEYPFGPLQMKKTVEGKLHCSDGPAFISPTRCIWYNDGKKHGLSVDRWGTVNYYFEGIRVPDRFFTHPDELTIEEILKQDNTEVRYAGIRIMGLEKLKNCQGYHLIHSDPSIGAELFSFDGVFDLIKLTFVQVTNSTAELDGTYKKYFLMVPPEMKTCHDAIAWTFREKPEDYHPDKEA